MICERCGGEIRQSNYVPHMWVHAHYKDWRNAPHNVVVAGGAK